jgi:hypothetical protein
MSTLTSPPCIDKVQGPDTPTPTLTHPQPCSQSDLTHTHTHNPGTSIDCNDPKNPYNSHYLSFTALRQTERPTLGHDPKTALRATSLAHRDATKPWQAEQEASLATALSPTFLATLFALFILPRLLVIRPACWCAGRRRRLMRRRPSPPVGPVAKTDLDSKKQLDRVLLRKARRRFRHRRSQRRRHKPNPRPFDSSLGFPGEGPGSAPSTYHSCPFADDSALTACPLSADLRPRVRCDYTARTTQVMCNHVNKVHRDLLPEVGIARNSFANWILATVQFANGSGTVEKSRFCDRCNTFFADNNNGRNSHAQQCDGSNAHLELMGLDSRKNNFPGALPPAAHGLVVQRSAVTVSGLRYLLPGSAPRVCEEMGSVAEARGVTQGQCCLFFSILRALPAGIEAVAALPHLDDEKLGVQRLEHLRRCLSQEAVDMRGRLAPLANLLAQQRGRESVDFSRHGETCEEEMIMSWALNFSPITVVARAGPVLGAARYAHPDHPATLQLPEVFVYNVDTGPQAHYQALVLADSGHGSGPAGGGGGGDGVGGSADGGSAGSWFPAQREVDETHRAAVLDIARCAAPLHALAPPSTWSEEQTRAWVGALAAFAPRIGPALQSTDRDKIGLVLDFLRLPATVLVPFLGAAAERSPQLKAFLAKLAGEGNRD